MHSQGGSLKYYVERECTQTCKRSISLKRVPRESRPKAKSPSELSVSQANPHTCRRLVPQGLVPWDALPTQVLGNFPKSVAPKGIQYLGRRTLGKIISRPLCESPSRGLPRQSNTLVVATLRRKSTGYGPSHAHRRAILTQEGKARRNILCSV